MMKEMYMNFVLIIFFLNSCLSYTYNDLKLEKKEVKEDYVNYSVFSISNNVEFGELVKIRADWLMKEIKEDMLFYHKNSFKNLKDKLYLNRFHVKTKITSKRKNNLFTFIIRAVLHGISLGIFNPSDIEEIEFDIKIEENSKEIFVKKYSKEIEIRDFNILYFIFENNRIEESEYKIKLAEYFGYQIQKDLYYHLLEECFSNINKNKAEFCKSLKLNKKK